MKYFTLGVDYPSPIVYHLDTETAHNTEDKNMITRHRTAARRRSDARRAIATARKDSAARKARTAGLAASLDLAAVLSSDSGLIPVDRRRWAR